MKPESSNSPNLNEENRRLREAIAEAQRHLRRAKNGLRKVLDEKAFMESTAIEVEFAMESAADAIEAASNSLQQPTAQSDSTTGGPTSQQGQFLAYIRDYMLLNNGLAPSHAEFQRFFRLTPPSVNSMLKRLDQKGFICRIPGQPRAIELTIDPKLIPTLDQP